MASFYNLDWINFYNMNYKFSKFNVYFKHLMSYYTILIYYTVHVWRIFQVEKLKIFVFFFSLFSLFLLFN